MGPFGPLAQRPGQALVCLPRQDLPTIDLLQRKFCPAARSAGCDQCNADILVIACVRLVCIFLHTHQHRRPVQSLGVSTRRQRARLRRKAGNMLFSNHNLVTTTRHTMQFRATLPKPVLLYGPHAVHLPIPELRAACSICQEAWSPASRPRPLGRACTIIVTMLEWIMY